MFTNRISWSVQVFHWDLLFIVCRLLAKNGEEIWIVTIKNKSCFQLFLFEVDQRSIFGWIELLLLLQRSSVLFDRKEILACCGWEMIVLLEVAGSIIICNFVLNWEQLICWSKFWFHEFDLCWLIWWFLCSLNLNLVSELRNCGNWAFCGWEMTTLYWKFMWKLSRWM
jgi:hypothetical protein